MTGKVRNELKPGDKERNDTDNKRNDTDNKRNDTDNKSIYLEIIRIIPSALWAFIVVTVLVAFYGPIRYDLMPRMGSVKATLPGGISFESNLNIAISTVQKASEELHIDFDVEDRDALSRRIRKVQPIYQGAQVLWIDDTPSNNNYERNALTALGVIVDIALNTNESLTQIDSKKYDVILSDMSRKLDDKPDSPAGFQFLKELEVRRKAGAIQPPYVIFYSANWNPETQSVPN